MDFLNEIENNTLLICNNSDKNNILFELSNLKKILNIKIMTITEFLNNYFFSYNEETIYYIKNKYNVTREMAIIYLNNIKYVINKNIDNTKVKFLQELYKDLKDKDLLKFNKLFKNYLKRVNIIIFNTDLDNFTLNILDKYNYKCIDNYIDKNSLKTINHFDLIDMEVEYTFNKISNLIKEGIDIENIKLVLLGREYESIVKRFSYLYNIKINNLNKYSIYGTINSKKFLELIKNGLAKEELLEFLKPNLDKEIYTCFLDIINKYYFVDNLNLVIDFIENDLKNTYFKELKNINALEVIDLDSSNIFDNTYVFILGFNLENIPKIYKDIDYFNDNLKQELLLDTSFDKNKKERNKIIKELKNIKNIYLSYKDNSPYNSYLISNLVKELNLEIKNIKIENNTSNLYNKIKLTNNLDILLKYGVKNADLDKLYNTYQDINYLTYDNSFKGLHDFKLDKLTLSYSLIDNYYRCGFRYYIDSILKLNEYKETFMQFIGTMFHEVLCHIYDDDFDFYSYLNDYLKDKEFSKKEKFYLNDLKIELENIIKVLKYQYSLTGLTKLKLEEQITINYKDNYKFTGIIDKIMFKEKDNNTYISIIDYKTGNPSINMSNLLYGLDMQLPIYVYLTVKSNMFNNPQIIGFYLEKILHEKNVSVSDQDKNNIDKLKLQGYSINDDYLVSIMDSSYQNSDMIKGMKITSKGFAHYTKVISNDAINKMINIVEIKINEAFNSIINGKFNINPKIIKGENLGCKYCKYNDLCFKTGRDYVYLEGYEDLSFLEEK